jgi:chondroitin 4-sulfotransferase 11
MIQDQYKCIFVHIIKTAGISICEALDMGSKQCHYPASKIRTHPRCGEHKWEKYFKFTFVRNPYDKLVSQYHYNRAKFRLTDLSFYEYIKHYNEGGQIAKYPVNNHEYIDLDLDYIGKFENLQQDMNYIFDRCRLPRLKIPHLNSSKHEHYTSYYNDETRSIVTKLFEKDLELFGYEFGS